MKMKAVQEIAKSRGLKPGKLPKKKLIKHIQIDEGNFDCFATAVDGYCDQLECCWRKECFKQAVKVA
jgi:hypothetical protein